MSNGWIWDETALSAYVPFMTAFIFNALQSVLVVFLVIESLLRERLLDSRGVFHVRPVDNFTYHAGKITGVMLAVLQLDVVVVALSVLFHLTLTPSPFALSPHLFYLVTLTLPTVVFVAGVAALSVTLVRVRFLAIVLPVGLLFLLGAVCQGCPAADLYAAVIDTIPSPAAGHPSLAAYLVQRVAFFLAGVAFILFTTASVARPPNTRRGKVPLVGVAACLLLLAGISFADRILAPVRDRAVVEACRAADRRSTRLLPVAVTAADIRVTPSGHSMEAIARLTLVNKSVSPLDSLPLFLNPGLVVRSALLDGRPVTVSRDAQLLVVASPLLPGDTATLQLDYAGTIDERVALIALPSMQDRGYFDTNRDVFFRHGRRYACLQEDLVLLLPEIYWYPSCTGTGVLSPRNLALFHLEVANKRGLRVISQGHPAERGDVITFTHDFPLPSIALVAGRYVKRAVTLADGNTVEVYHFRDNHLVASYLHDLSARRARYVLASRAPFSMGDISHPFRTLRFVEVPSFINFRHNPFRRDASNVLPGIFLWREEGIKHVHGDFVFKPTREDFSIDPGIIPHMNLSRGGYNDYTSLFIDNMYEIDDRAYPGLSLAWRNRIFATYDAPFIREFANESPDEHAYDLHAYVPPGRGFEVEYRGDTCAVCAYLAAHSLADAVIDTTLSPVFLSALVKNKGGELLNAVLEHVDVPALHAISRRLSREYPFAPVPFDTLVAALNAAGGVDYRPIIDAWYRARGVAEISIRDVRVESIDGPTGKSYRIRFFIRSTGTRATRFFTCYNRGSSRYMEKDTYSVSHVIAPGECLEACIPTVEGTYPRYVMIVTEMAINQPSMSYYEFRTPAPAFDEVPPGVRPADPALFRPDPMEIVVDDRDAGFSVVYEERRRKLAGNAGRRGWEKRIVVDAYGEPIKSFRSISRGTGKSSAFWKASIDTGGTYDLHVYVSHIDYTVTWNYTVTPPGGDAEEIPVTFPQGTSGWFLVGRFHLEPGTAVVALSDQTNTREPVRDYDSVRADAIKWRRVEE
ncbi:MAG: hypothetical protein LBP56_10400 [Odoribacteraceae bacterium]|nr:hypothetical protein [Odoribacteraceae bacterium]